MIDVSEEFMEEYFDTVFEARHCGVKHSFNKTEYNRLYGFADIGLELLRSGKDHKQYLSDIMQRCRHDIERAKMQQEDE